MNDNWIVFIEDGYTKLMSPKGELLTSEVEGVLTNPVRGGDNPSTYKATFLVDLADSKEHAEKIINERYIKRRNN